jgi:hypothetical protein
MEPFLLFSAAAYYWHQENVDPKDWEAGFLQHMKKVLILFFESR